ncbi:MAG: hypothetical protein U0414_30405 [Polyangiaceae bacterium]
MRPASNTTSALSWLARAEARDTRERSASSNDAAIADSAIEERWFGGAGRVNRGAAEALEDRAVLATAARGAVAHRETCNAFCLRPLPEIPASVAAEPDLRGHDVTYGVSSSAFTSGAQVNGTPAIMARGGHRTNGTDAGIFSIQMADSPRAFNALLGFRCVIPR